MSSADSRIRDGLPLRFAHSASSACCRIPIFVFHSLQSQARQGSGRDIPLTPGILIYRFSLFLFRSLFRCSSFRDAAGLPG